MEYKTLLEAFTEKLDMPAVTPDPDGRARLTFDRDLEVVCLPEGPGKMVLTAVVGRIPANEPAASKFIRAVLNINLADARIQEEVLSLDPDKGDMILHRRMSIHGLTAEDLEPVMEHFVNSLESWRNRIIRLEEETGSPLGGMFA